MEKEKPFLYIDTNFSYDEALMVDLALRSEAFELVGISTNQGFMNKKKAGENILGLGEVYGLFLPVVEGRSYNLKKEPLEFKEKGEIIYEPKKDYLEDVDVYDNLYDLARDTGSLNILTTGPLTNIGGALEKYPDLEDYISHIFISGGSLGEIEENFAKDPLAIDIILNSSIDLFIIPKDISRQVEIGGDFLEGIKTKENAKIIDGLIKSKARNFNASLSLYLIESPEAFIYEEGSFKVDREYELGKLERSNTRKKNYLAIRVNEESFLAYIKDSYQ
ncbi:MAG: nucleoside hydrolase [Anaerococcus sp.]|nr:nucleoside hydrolase [Anaerococcus sp.]